MKKIRTADLRAGMKFSKAVFIDPNNILVGPNVSVKQKDIDRLLAWGIEELETAGDVTDMGGDVEDELASPIADIAKKKAELTRIVELQNKNRSTLARKMEGRDKPEEPALKSEDFKEQILLDPSRTILQEEYQKWVQVVKNAFFDAGMNNRIDKAALKKVAEAILAHLDARKAEIIQKYSGFENDDYLSAHCVNVALLGGILGQRLGLNREKLVNLLLGCLMIDLGMVKIPAFILEKHGTLSAEEIKTVRTHPLLAYRILVQENGFPHESGLVLLEHHEQCDGGGYPRGLAEDKISLFGKIGAVVDTYAAMTQRRSYREEMISFDAMKSVLATGQRRFDQNILSSFLKEMGVYPVGSYVQLNNNSIGIVIEADQSLPMRPNIKVVLDEFGDQAMDEEVIKLSVEPDLYIIKPLSREEIDALPGG